MPRSEYKSSVFDVSDCSFLTQLKKLTIKHILLSR